jgi:hypothetical protein
MTMTNSLGVIKSSGFSNGIADILIYKTKHIGHKASIGWSLLRCKPIAGIAR